MNSAMIDYLQTSTGLAENTVTSVAESFLKFIQISLRDGNEVKFEKFGTFYVKDVPERMGRNPRTGESILIPARKRPDFKFSKTFIGTIQPDAAAGSIASSEPTPAPAPIPAATAPTTAPTPAAIPVAIPVATEPTVASPERKLPPPVPSGLLVSSAKSWFVSVNGQSQEFMEKDLPSVASLETPVWSEETGWKLAKDIPAIAYLFNQAA